MKYRVVVNEREVEVNLHSRNGSELTFSVEGTAYTTTITPDLTKPSLQSSTPTPSSGAANEIFAPMPGIIISVAAKEEELISAGSTAIVIEAMKMENNITIPFAAKVLRVHVAPGDEVDAGQLLVELAPEK